jgi:hypothetical protein
VVWSFVYLALCRLVQLVVLLCRSTNTNTQPEIDQFPYPRTSQALRHFHIFQRFTRAREYQIDRVDVNVSPVRFGPLLIRFGESNARVSNLPNHRGLAEFLNPTRLHQRTIDVHQVTGIRAGTDLPCRAARRAHVVLHANMKAVCAHATSKRVRTRTWRLRT